MKNSKSFYDWCMENNRQDVLDRWDYNLNDYSPKDITYGTKKKCYLKCPRELHESELYNLHGFTKRNGLLKCRQCNSFAQWGIDNVDSQFFDKYWDYDKNKEINPWKISCNSTNKIYIKCQTHDYHDSYSVLGTSFTTMNCRCPYCTNRNGKVHPLDSLGKLLEDKGLLNIWSDENKKTPYEYTPWTSQKVWWRCLDKKHEDYYKKISDANKCDFRCPECVRERNESFLQEKVRLYLESLNIGQVLHEYNCTIIPINPKTNHKLPFDNEIKELKLIAEVMGKQHYELTGFHYKSSKQNNTTPEYELHMLQVRDRYKKFISYKRGYEYIAIPYWIDDKEETWKQLINNKIDEILKINK